VEFAPEASLINANDDIDATGNCLEEIKNYCSDLTAGGSELADCISDHITESEAGTGDDVPHISDACREEVYQFKVQRDSNINLNVPLAKACKIDAETKCNVTWFFGYKAGQVIACLRDVKERVAPACKKELFKVQKDAAEDYRADPQLYEACKDDAANLCKDVKNGGGRVQACLRDKRMQLSWTCEEQLFRQEMENSDDIRLSVRLFSKCINDKKKFCPDVAPGNAKVKDCLEEHRTDPDFSEECKEEVDAMIERRVRDFRLDSRLRTVCETEIYSMCAYFGDLDSASGDASVVRCLQDFLEEITSPQCRDQVVKYQQLAAEDIRFDVPLADACYEDRVKLCSAIPPGSARVIRCLLKQRNSLGSKCRATLFDEEMRFSQNIDFQYPMRKACKLEISLFCKDVPHGEARVIRCLQDNKYQKEFTKECKEEVREYEMEAASDYRLNYRLNKACKEDVATLCHDVCKAEEGQVCGGTVLRCLTEKRDDIKSEACQKEVFYFEKMEVSDYRNDVILAAACRADVESYCKDVDPGNGAVHDCLRRNRAKLSETCRKEELILEEQEAENVELRPGILKSCKDERTMFCKNVAPGQARVFRCLAEKMGDADFGPTCRNEIIVKLHRRQANWKLDPPLRKACKPAVQRLCEAEDKQNSEEGYVYKCLIKNYLELDAGCQKELGRAMHMAFFVWQPGAILTSVCDEDITEQCLSKRPNMAKTPGAVGSCLASILEELAGKQAGAVYSGRTLSDECRAFADVAEPPNMKQAFEASLSVALLQSQLSVIESSTGVQMLNRDKQGNAQSVTLTGWTALLGMAAMVGLLIFGATFAYKYFTGRHDGYTLVVKKGGR